MSESRFDDKGQGLHRTAKQVPLLAAPSTSKMFRNCRVGRRVKVSDKTFIYGSLKKSQCICPGTTSQATSKANVGSRGMQRIRNPFRMIKLRRSSDQYSISAAPVDRIFENFTAVDRSDSGKTDFCDDSHNLDFEWQYAFFER